MGALRKADGLRARIRGLDARSAEFAEAQRQLLEAFSSAERALAGEQ